MSLTPEQLPAETQGPGSGGPETFLCLIGEHPNSGWAQMVRLEDLSALKNELDKARYDYQVCDSVRAAHEKENKALRAELAKLRAGGQVTRGQLERLEEFKRQIRENRR